MIDAIVMEWGVISIILLCDYKRCKKPVGTTLNKIWLDHGIHTMTLKFLQYLWPLLKTDLRTIFE